jgi:galactofuranosylgalactofuranosylrhamnosyl-N-acetylglucosaminyl-diphospho-decaprenol beta-1,5/1,6-galactofuranosyltransferase
MRYGLAALTIRAIEDFLRGPEVLADGGVETSAGVRKLWSEYPETINHPASAVPGVADVAMPKTADPGAPSMLGAILAKRIIWQLLRKARGTAAISSADAHWWHVSLFDTAVVTDPSQEGVRVRRFDRAVMIDLARRGGAVLVRLVREGERVRDQYRAALPELTGRDTWKKLFDSE